MEAQLKDLGSKAEKKKTEVNIPLISWHNYTNARRQIVELQTAYKQQQQKQPSEQPALPTAVTV